MAIRNDWIVVDSTARNALEVTHGDVQQGAECRLLTDGSIYRAIASGTGAACWDPVTLAAISDEVQTDVPFSYGTWAPTRTYTGVVASSTVGGARYTRIGDVVNFSFTLGSITPSGAGAYTIDFSLPIASAFSASADLVGVASTADVALTLVSVLGDATNDRGEIRATAPDTTTHSLRVVGSYVVI